jgi:capsular polysaccharide biosynthesis protein
MIADYRRALSPSALSHSVYKNVTLTPGVFAPEQAPTRIQFGAFSEGKVPIDAFRFHRQNSQSSLDQIYPDDVIRLSGTYIYGGVIQNQYGAFLTETLSRLWFFQESKNLPILWHHIHKREIFLPFQNEILSLAGVALARSKIINHPILVDNIIVPDSGCVLDCWLAAPQADALNVFPFARLPSPNRRVWLSRSKLRDGLGKVQGEELLEAELAAKGWTILTPESQPVWWQLQAMSDAEEIAGFEGSAFHTLILAAGCEAQITLYARGKAFFQ